MDDSRLMCVANTERYVKRVSFEKMFQNEIVFLNFQAHFKCCNYNKVGLSWLLLWNFLFQKTSQILMSCINQTLKVVTHQICIYKNEGLWCLFGTQIFTTWPIPNKFFTYDSLSEWGFKQHLDPSLSHPQGLVV